MYNDSFAPLPVFKFWCQKVLPLVYDPSLSLYEVMCKVIDYLNNVIKDVNILGNQVGVNTSDIEQLKQELAVINAELEKVKNGDYVSLYINALASWIDANLQELVGRIVKYVFFGLTDDGYFCAYIPESWQFIDFDTVMTPDDPLYGHLLLRW